MTKKLLILSLVGLLLPSLVFAAFSYTRTPIGYTISNPVSFDVSFDEFGSDVQCDWQAGADGWGLAYVYPETLDEFVFSTPRIITDPCISLLTEEDCEPQEGCAWLGDVCEHDEPFGYTFVETLPTREYWQVVTTCYEGENWLGFETGSTMEAGSPAFEVIEEEIPPVSLFSISAGDITSLWGFASGLFSDAKLLVLLAIGVPVAFYVIKRAIGLAPKGR